MPSSAPLPPLLLPHLSTPSDGTLTLLTSTLGASTNWLVLRCILAGLKPPEHESNIESATGYSNVVLVSWLREPSAWQDAAKKIGIDCKKLIFVDALGTSLGTPMSGGLTAVEKTILDAIRDAGNASDGPGAKVLLVLDGLDYLLAATASPWVAFMDMICELRSNVHSTLLAFAADSPLIQSPTTSLEASHAALVLGLAHHARLVMSLRELDTGVAKDVSGVLRITQGGGVWESAESDLVEDKEYLYFVGNDGTARVFERGA